MPTSKTIANSSFLFVAMAILFSGCGVYSFTGASIPAGAKTVSVQYFPNKAQLVEPILSPTFTNALLNIFTTQTTLEMVETNGDIALEGEIISYKTTPVAIQSDQTAALNRLTIVVNVRFANKLEPEKDFEQKFSQFLEYPSEQPLNAVSGELIAAINEMLVTDIFNKAVVNW
ncbi:MAG: LPS assembly lipoprotein LptE [Bacteroidales bacterium]|nr:LPS assembly lipoprotein LptE [Bacteroidales bacterium]MCF6341560.1 LPS assembly lipoprotein LptE [Bacteroidales bacterium]